MKRLPLPIITLLLLFIFTSCATHTKDKSVAHHHHRTKMLCKFCPVGIKAHYDGVKEEEIALEDRHKNETEEFQLYYDGIYYYFTSQEKLDTFVTLHKNKKKD